MMGPKTRKHNKPDYRKSRQQKYEQLCNSDVDDSSNPANQSTDAKIFPAHSIGKLEDQRDEQKSGMAHAFSEAGTTISCLHSDLSLSGSASMTGTDEPDAISCGSQEVGGKVNRRNASIEPAESDAVSASCSASERLMQQIDSLLRDSEFVAPYKHELDFAEFEVNHTDSSVPEPKFKLEPGLNIPEMSSSYSGTVTKFSDVTELYNGASHNVRGSQDAEKLSEVKPLSNLVRGDFFLADDESLENFLNLLHRLIGICCESEFHQELCLDNMGKHNDNEPQIDHERLHVHDSEKCDTLSELLTKVDHLEDSIEDTKEEEVRRLLLSITKLLRKNQFSSAMELTNFLEVVEQMKVVIDQWCQHIQNRTKTASIRDNDDTTLDSASAGATNINDAIAVLRTKPSQILTQLSSSLILWQDFIETRAELEHELTLEKYLLNSIEANINSNESLKTKLEAEHDLRLVEGKLEDYSEKIASLRSCNRQLDGILDDDTLRSNLSQTGILASELQSIKDSCSSLRSMLRNDAAPDKAIYSTPMTSEQKHSVHSSFDEMEKSAEDFDKPMIAPHLVLKLILLLFLIILLLLIVTYFEPHYLYHPWNRFRLPVPIHVRHVGTYPPT